MWAAPEVRRQCKMAEYRGLFGRWQRSDSGCGEEGVKGFARDARGTNPHHSVVGGADRPIPQAYTKSRKIGAAETE